MALLRKKYIEEYNTDIVRGYIQENGFNPLKIILYSEPQLKFVASQKDIFLHLDATGSIVAQPINTNEQYNGLLIPGGLEFCPLEAAEAILSDHSERSVKKLFRMF